MQFVSGVAFGILVGSIVVFVREVLRVRESKADRFTAGMAMGGIVYATITLLAIIGAG